ncbi:MAG: hypothetical protein DME20_05660 [Verrucomicrobia bacterium]|nr:MAG: hypothetical protein DME20_05660 [Verrucomicrobiota bacterium]TMB73850.1 MAG: hypothetical protein E6J54_05015 [Deltaproteobacteria bacterium]
MKKIINQFSLPWALIGLFAAPAGAVPMGQSDHALLNPITGGDTAVYCGVSGPQANQEPLKLDYAADLRAPRPIGRRASA